MVPSETRRVSSLLSINIFMGLVMYQVSVSDSFGEQGRAHGALDCLRFYCIIVQTDDLDCTLEIPYRKSGKRTSNQRAMGDYTLGGTL